MEEGRPKKPAIREVREPEEEEIPPLPFREEGIVPYYYRFPSPEISPPKGKERPLEERVVKRPRMKEKPVTYSKIAIAVLSLGVFILGLAMGGALMQRIIHIGGPAPTTASLTGTNEITGVEVQVSFKGRVIGEVPPIWVWVDGRKVPLRSSNGKAYTRLNVNKEELRRGIVVTFPKEIYLGNMNMRYVLISPRRVPVILTHGNFSKVNATYALELNCSEYTSSKVHVTPEEISQTIKSLLKVTERWSNPCKTLVPKMYVTGDIRYNLSSETSGVSCGDIYCAITVGGEVLELKYEKYVRVRVISFINDLKVSWRYGNESGDFTFSDKESFSEAELWLRNGTIVNFIGKDLSITVHPFTGKEQELKLNSYTVREPVEVVVSRKTTTGGGNSSGW